MRQMRLVRSMRAQMEGKTCVVYAAGIIVILSAIALGSASFERREANFDAVKNPAQEIRARYPVAANAELLPLSDRADGPGVSFPASFMWGTATSAYQIEGAAAEDGRTPSIWDEFSKHSSRMKTVANGDVACDHYHRYREDIMLLKALGVKYYRFSIAWPRILPHGARGGPNQKGIAFYSSLIDEMLKNGITPVATLYHWDLPISVQNATKGGWIGDGTVADEFAAYARVCYKEFGDRVKWWITLNEPWCSSLLAYVVGEHAPGKTDAPGTDPYRAGHNLLRAHAQAVSVYRKEFVTKQNGKIGITLNSDWGEPAPNSTEAAEAAKRFMEFNLGWYAEPIYKGDYPAAMRQTVGSRLPTFTTEEKASLLGSADFFGLNHYTTQLITGYTGTPGSPVSPGSYSFWNDEAVRKSADPSWGRTDMGWPILPSGFRKVLNYIQKEYNPPGGIIVTENGIAVSEPSLQAALADSSRETYYKDYITELRKAIVEDKVNVKGYFLWSLMDNFEWAYGYTKRFGLHYVDYATQKRTPKPAAKWYTNLVAENRIPN